MTSLTTKTRRRKLEIPGAKKENIRHLLAAKAVYLMIVTTYCWDNIDIIVITKKQSNQSIIMSTAWYRSRCVPQMIQRWTSPSVVVNNHNLVIEVWDTTCVVHNMKHHADILLNPANPQLSGVSKFPYFPIGGPQPPPGFEINKDTHPIMGYVSQWGGMEVGNGMMFASNVVDGLVHQLGGKELQRQLQQIILRQRGVTTQLAEGEAVVTTTESVGTLQETTGYRFIIHAVPPFYKHENNTSIDESTTTTTTTEVLAETYRNALRAAADLAPSLQLLLQGASTSENDDDDFRIRIATPLLGAGCRGFPVDIAIETAAKTLMQSSTSSTTTTFNTPMTLAFAIPNGEIRQQLVDALDDHSKEAAMPQ
jgi:O-acetyl-ADP-ribose deacetylase (regulator of RNase III)